ncbi:MAG: DJ-1/PfpI family protein [Candidatus Riflebacteria bacterium]|nr:DJ-1/PfpI family protein [Candidatus Riflebacteria bacterium]
MAEAWVLMAQGFEEAEFAVIVDILRRAGVNVKTVSLNSTLDPIMGSRDIKMIPDTTIDEVLKEECDLVVLPGGVEGSFLLGEDPRVLQLTRKMVEENRFVAAMCASSTVLIKAGLLNGRHATSHPGVELEMVGAVYHRHRVVVDGHIITSRAPGTTFDFAFKLVEMLLGREKVWEVNKGVLALLPDQLPE